MATPNFSNLNGVYVEEKDSVRIFAEAENYTGGTTPDIFLRVEIIAGVKKVALFFDVGKDAIVTFDITADGQPETREVR